jgi:hypothetical protein
LYYCINSGTYSVKITNANGCFSICNKTVTLYEAPVASTITASGATTFCAGGSVILSGNVGGVWNTGATTSSITVNTSGDYFVTNTTGCGTAISNHIAVIVNSLPVCNITVMVKFVLVKPQIFVHLQVLHPIFGAPVQLPIVSVFLQQEHIQLQLQRLMVAVALAVKL